MDKRQFLQALRKRLSALPKAELEERLRFYNEMIDDRMEEGLSEAEALEAVGSVEQIAAQIFGEEARPVVKPKKTGLEIALLILGFPLWFPLLVSAFAVALSLYISLWAVIVSLWAVFGALAGCACGPLVAGICLCMAGRVPAGMLCISGGLICGGLSIFLFFGCKALTRGAAILTKQAFLLVFRRKEAA